MVALTLDNVLVSLAVRFLDSNEPDTVKVLITPAVTVKELAKTPSETVKLFMLPDPLKLRLEPESNPDKYNLFIVDEPVAKRLPVVKADAFTFNDESKALESVNLFDVETMSPTFNAFSDELPATVNDDPMFK